MRKKLNVKRKRILHLTSLLRNLPWSSHQIFIIFCTTSPGLDSFCTQVNGKTNLEERKGNTMILIRGQLKYCYVDTCYYVNISVGL